MTERIPDSLLIQVPGLAKSLQMEVCRLLCFRSSIILMISKRGAKGDAAKACEKYGAGKVSHVQNQRKAFGE